MLCPRMRIGVDSPETIKANVCVDLGGINGGVSKQILNHSQVRSALEKVSSKRMSQSMRRDLLLDLRFLRVFEHNSVH